MIDHLTIHIYICFSFSRKIFASKTLTLGDVLEIDFTPSQSDDTEKSNITEEKIALKAMTDLQRLVNFTSHILDERRQPPVHILYEDNDFAVVYKPAGLHSMKWIGTMKNQLFALDDVLPLILQAPVITSENMNITDSLERPLPCHRLDARVSGCLLVAKTHRAMTDLSKQFELRLVDKEYTAILVGKTILIVLLFLMSLFYFLLFLLY